MAQFNQLNCSIDYDDSNDDKSNEDSLYIEWMIKVEKIVYESVQMYLDDLPDENYRINFDDGMCHEDMARIVLRYIEPIDDMINETVNDFCIN